MQRYINTIAILMIALVPAVGRAQSRSVYMEQVDCQGGSFGLRLPRRLPEVMKLGPVKREEVREVEKWEGYTATRKYVYFAGFTLGLVTFSNDPNRYMVSFAEITDPRWTRVAPFSVGESVDSARGKLGAPAANDPELKATYGSEGGDISFQSSGGKITKITYGCYTG